MAQFRLRQESIRSALWGKMSLQPACYRKRFCIVTIGRVIYSPAKVSREMSPSVKLNDVIEALESAGDEHAHYLDERTGEIVLVTDEDMKAAEGDELISEYPDWQRDSIMKAREVLSDSQQFIELPD